MNARVLKPLRATGHFLVGRAQDHPGWVNLLLLAAVVAHAAATLAGSVPDVFDRLTGSTEAVTIYLALAGPASIVSGFAGVVVVFGLTLTSGRFRQFRVRAGRQLRATWTSTSVCGFVAVALSLLAALLSTADPQQVAAAGAAPWLFELGVAILAHGVLRLIWILRKLIDLVQADDTDEVREAGRTPLDQLPFNRRRAS